MRPEDLHKKSAGFSSTGDKNDDPRLQLITKIVAALRDSILSTARADRPIGLRDFPAGSCGDSVIVKRRNVAAIKAALRVQLLITPDPTLIRSVVAA